MSNLLNKLEHKIGRYAIRNLTIYMIIMYAAGYLMQILAGSAMLEYLTLDIYKIGKFQIWRFFTWLFIPPGTIGIFTIFMLFMYYWLGTMLERQWGSFKYNLFIFSGIFFTIIGAVITYFVLILKVGNNPATDITVAALSRVISFRYNTYYINTSIFIAFASIFPNERLYLYFIIPIKIKWLAAFDIALLTFDFIKGGFVNRVLILTSLLNLIIFIIISYKSKNIAHSYKKREHYREKKANSTDREYTKMFGKDSKISKHKCVVCGRTDLTNPELEFRFCSKCKGAYEYCNDHLFTHIHRQ